jgi:ubiquinone/menaquinone biosynthesis C-methylase UbiE
MKNQPQGKGHINKQRDLFNKEFLIVRSSNLAEWQKSYLERMEKYLLKGKRKGEIIELGCGDGKLSTALAKKGYQLTACDISDTAIKLVKKFAKEKDVLIKTVRCDVTKMKFPDNKFDFAIANSILEHLEDEEKALKEWSRILKPGGRIVIVTPLRQRHVFPLLWIVNWFHDRRLGHIRRYDKKRYTNFSQYGLELKKVVYTGHTPKVFLTLINIFVKNKQIEKLAEKVDTSLHHLQYDGNNIIGFFEKSKKYPH